jgi:hypothetical protein
MLNRIVPLEYFPKQNPSAPAADRRIPAHMLGVAAVLDVSYPSARCPQCRRKTCGRLYHKHGVKICAGCAAGQTLKRAR